MTPFTASELAFLARHNFSPDEVHDGRGQNKWWRELQAKESGKILILTSVRCQAMGHRIRTRAGHCAQCKPASIGFTKRETLLGYVYIAGSLRERFIKIGVTEDIRQRERQLNTDRYGGASDWMVLHYDRLENMQRVEREIASRISGKRIFNGYIKDGHERIAEEIIQCSFSAALDAYADVTGGVGNKAELLKQWREYEFD
jgi:hypothetical protein